MSIEKDRKLKEQIIEKKTLNAQKVKDEKKIKDLQAELKKLKDNELAMSKNKIVKEKPSRGIMGDDNDSDEDEPRMTRA